MKLCNKAYDEVKELLKVHENEVKTVAAELIKKETLELDQLAKILGKRDDKSYGKLMECVEDKKKAESTTKPSSNLP